MIGIATYVVHCCSHVYLLVPRNPFHSKFQTYICYRQYDLVTERHNTKAGKSQTLNANFGLFSTYDTSPSIM